MAEQERMTRSEEKDGVVVVSFLATHVGIDTEGRLSQELKDCTGDATSPQVLISLAGVSYVSSGPLGVLTALERDVSKRGGTLKFCAVAAYVMETFRAAGLLRLFEVHDNCQEALASFKQTPGGTVAG